MQDSKRKEDKPAEPKQADPKAKAERVSEPPVALEPPLPSSVSELQAELRRIASALSVADASGDVPAAQQLSARIARACALLAS